jgi:Cdc6-like AAA superfamily ATPase
MKRSVLTDDERQTLGVMGSGPFHPRASSSTNGKRTTGLLIVALLAALIGFVVGTAIDGNAGGFIGFFAGFMVGWVGPYTWVASITSAATAWAQERGRVDRVAISDKYVTAEDDQLDYTAYARVIADFVLTSNRTNGTISPLCVAIDGTWGSGKTSLLHMIAELVVRKTDNTPIVWFSAWQYEGSEQLWAAFMSRFVRDISQVILRRGLAGYASIWWVIMRTRMRYNFALAGSPVVALCGWSVAVAGLIGLLLTCLPHLNTAGLVYAVIAGLGMLTAPLWRLAVGVFDLKLANHLPDGTYADRVGFVDQFTSELGSLVRLATDNGRTPVVVFIDDVDRCSPRAIMDVFEAMDTISQSEQSNSCIFVIAFNSLTVAASIEATYKDLADQALDDGAGRSRGQRFLDKVVQINLRLPPVANPQVFRLARQSLGLEVASTPPRAVPLPDRVPFEQDPAVYASMIDYASELLGRNPRRIKTFINMCACIEVSRTSEE